MSTEVTPESLRTHAKWLRDAEGWSSQAHIMDAVADRLEREHRPLPTVPGWYPGIVVERGGESCTGALLPDDLSPAEQARAARWAADWLASETYPVGARALWSHADELDPPETVESLRAERDKALADVTHWREQYRLVCDESEDRKGQVEAVTAELAQVRADHEQAEAERVPHRSTHTEAEAAWGRCQRED